jgi:hypothetical protein
MILNKKAFVLTFLVGLLLTAIIFIPTCIFVSEFFRTSSQAKENFNSFIDDFKTLAEPNIVEGAKKTSLLILDDKTTVVYFSGEPNAKMLLQIYATNDDVLKVEMARPSQCQKENKEWPKGCFCLVRDAVIEKKENEIDNFVINPTKMICTKVDFSAKFTEKDCGFGEPQDVKFYNCYDGFIFERGLFAAQEIYPNYKNERRMIVTLEKTAEGISVNK